MDDFKVSRKLIDRITTEWADKGKIIEGGWVAYVATSGLASAPEIQRNEMRKSYFIGAQHLFASIMTILEPGNEATDMDLRRITLIHNELEAFRRSLLQ